MLLLRECHSSSVKQYLRMSLGFAGQQFLFERHGFSRTHTHTHTHTGEREKKTGSKHPYSTSGPLSSSVSPKQNVLFECLFVCLCVFIFVYCAFMFMLCKAHIVVIISTTVTYAKASHVTMIISRCP